MGRQSMRGASLLPFTQVFISVSVILELTFKPRASGHHRLNHSYKKHMYWMTLAKMNLQVPNLLAIMTLDMTD